MALHNDIGHLGEQCAVELLEKKKYKILERNWRLGKLEIDIIAANQKEIVFVEVKTRTSTIGGQPEEAVDQQKRRFMTVAANAYIKFHHEQRNIRFDIIGIVMKKSGEIEQISHYENAFTPPERTRGNNSFIGRWRWKNR